MKKRTIFVGQGRATTTQQKPAKASTAAETRLDSAAEKQLISSYKKKLEDALLTGKKIDKATKVIESWLNDDSTKSQKTSKKAA